MSDYVWCKVACRLADGRHNVQLNPGEVWWADDPVVVDYPQYFSATPRDVRSSVGRRSPGFTALSEPAESTPGMSAAEIGRQPEPVEGEVPVVRRGPGRPRKAAANG